MRAILVTFTPSAGFDDHLRVLEAVRLQLKGDGLVSYCGSALGQEQPWCLVKVEASDFDFRQIALALERIYRVKSVTPAAESLPVISLADVEAAPVKAATTATFTQAAG